MFDFDVNNQEAVLELDLTDLEGGVVINNHPLAPADVIYMILPKSYDSKDLFWNSTTTLNGPKADLVMLMQSDLVISNQDFQQFDHVLISDNKFCRDGSRFLVIKEDEYDKYKVEVNGCEANHIYFFCNKVQFLSSKVLGDLFVKLNGNDSELNIKGSNNIRSIVGDLIIHKDHSPQKIDISSANILRNFNCDGVDTLSVSDLKTGHGICQLFVKTIEELSDFHTLSDELMIMSSDISISSFIAPRGKIYIESDAFIEFHRNGDGNFTGLELNIDVTKAIEKSIKMPFGQIVFDKININGASVLYIPGNLSAGELIITNCNEIKINFVNVGHFTYETSTGHLSCGDQGAGRVKINSLWFIGNIVADFLGPSEVDYIDTDKGRCSINVYDDFNTRLINLNLSLDRKLEKVNSESDGYFGLEIRNDYDKEVQIGTILAKLNKFYVAGGVKLNKVMIEPVDIKYNLLYVDVQHRNKIFVEEFFVSFDHNIVIDKSTGKISLVQSADRAIESGQIITNFIGSCQNYLQIRAGNGLRFDGDVNVIDGDIELFTMFRELSVRGSLKASKQIRLLAAEGSLDLTAHCDALSVITYAKTGAYLSNAIIMAQEILSHAVGKYVLLDSTITAKKVGVISQSDNIMILSSKIAAALLHVSARGDFKIHESTVDSNNQSYDASNIYSEHSFISGNANFITQEDIGIVSSVLKGSKVVSKAGGDIRIILSMTGVDYFINEADCNISIRASDILSSGIYNNAKGNFEIADESKVATNIIANISGCATSVDNSDIYAQKMICDSNQGIKIDSSLIIGEHSIFFKSVSNYLAVNSEISLSQYQHKLFLYQSPKDPNLARCGFVLPSLEAIGIVGSKSYSHIFSEFEYHLVDSSQSDLGIFSYLAASNPKAIMIDAYTGVIIGSQLNAKSHNVIIKSQYGIELLPLGLYNAAMFSGGFTEESAKVVISKIEAGLIDIDGGRFIKSIGALLSASSGSLKADYIIDEEMMKEISARHKSLQELQPWLGNNRTTYDMIVNRDVVKTRLEFSEVTKIDLFKGQVNVFYPYQSKEVYLRQREGDLRIDRDVHFSNEVIAISLDKGKLFFGAPKTEHQMIWRFFYIKHNINHTTGHVNVTGNDLSFSASEGIDIYAKIDAKNLNLKSNKDVKIVADKHNFGTNIQKSIVRADNTYITADNISIVGSIITVKDHLKLISHNDIKVIPLELLTRYSYHIGSKTTVYETAIKKIVSEINAGMLNIDVGRAAEFVGALVAAEGLEIHTKDLKILEAKEIFNKQVEFQGKKKCHGGRQRSTTHDRYETVIPTIMSVGTFRMIVDNDSTIEASQIFVRDSILTRVGGNLVIKDGYELHIHDYHSKKYGLCSFKNGGVKFCYSKSVKEHSSETLGVPTLVCSAGIFYGVVEGKMHVLGSKIIGKDIHIAVPKGLKVEASKYTDKSLIFVDEIGEKLEFYGKNRNEFGVRAGVYATKDEQEMWCEHLSRSSLVAEGSLTILVKDGTFEQISSDLAAKICTVEARNWIAKTYDESVVSDHLHQHIEGGIKIGVKQNITAAIDKAKMLINKRGSHIIDQADRVFKAYDMYKSFASLPTNATTGGIYAYLEGSSTELLSRYSIASDNTVSGETIIARISQDISFEGVRMTARDVDIEASNFTFEASQNKYDMEYDFGNIDLDIGLLNPALSTIGGSVKSSSVNSVSYNDNYIKASGNLKITLSGNGNFKCVSLEGVAIHIKANNLILESVQDIVKKKLSGMNVHIGLGAEYNINSFGAGIEAGSEKSAWTNQVARIIGSSCVNIVVKETLDIVGGLIANAEENKDGSLSDKGNLNINCARLIAKTLHDYDEGVTLGIGASFQVNQEASNDKSSVTFSHAPLKVEFKDRSRDVRSIIGHGSVKAGSVDGDSLSRSVNEQFITTSNESASFDSVIHEDMARTLRGDPKPKGQPTVKEIVREISEEDNIPTMIAKFS